jgi:hypothetical protein
LQSVATSPVVRTCLCFMLSFEKRSVTVYAKCIHGCHSYRLCVLRVLSHVSVPFVNKNLLQKSKKSRRNRPPPRENQPTQLQSRSQKPIQPKKECGSPSSQSAPSAVVAKPTNELTATGRQDYYEGNRLQRTSLGRRFGACRYPESRTGTRRFARRPAPEPEKPKFTPFLAFLVGRKR